MVDSVLQTKTFEIGKVSKFLTNISHEYKSPFIAFISRLEMHSEIFIDTSVYLLFLKYNAIKYVVLFVESVLLHKVENTF